jgi:hypothetical protein
MPNINVFDVRTEKVFAGASWLGPIAITPPRIARVGVKFVW